jgi:hypothetical protein
VSKIGDDVVPTVHEPVIRDKDVDDWFDERFEAMKEDDGAPVEEEVHVSVLKDSDEVDEDDPLAEMMDMNVEDL